MLLFNFITVFVQSEEESRVTEAILDESRLLEFKSVKYFNIFGLLDG